MTYEQLVTLAHLVFRLVLIYRIVASIPFIISSIPNIVRSIQDAKKTKRELDIEMEREKLRIESFKTGKEAQRSNYKRTNIGFTATCPVDHVEP